MSVVSFDTETHLIQPGLLAPPLVCLQWCHDDVRQAMMAHRDNSKGVIFAWLKSDTILVGHNVAFDMAVIAAQWPDLLPLIFAKYDRNQITDSLLREQLIMIARGTFRRQMGSDGELYPVKYSLADCVRRHFGTELKKEGFRLFYRLFDDQPDTTWWTDHARTFQANGSVGVWPDWVSDYLHRGILKKADIDGLLAAPPEEAVEYALKDADTTLSLYESQERWFGDALADQFRQARAAFALHLSSCWGLVTDPDAVDALEVKLLEEFEDLKRELQLEGIVREDGSADTKMAMAAMVAACEEEGIPVVLTKGGAVSLSAEACARVAISDDEAEDAPLTTIGMYSRFLKLRKTLSNDIKMLRTGSAEAPIQPRYDLADTGRARASKPNIQAINKGAGIREAFRPREGTCFIQADYPSLELYTLAAWCYEQFGHSVLGDLLNAGKDVHIEVASQMMGIPYEEAIVRYKAGDPEAKKKRQASKAVNYGLPGGLGAKKLAKYARTQYGVDMTLEEGMAFKATWLATFPETNEFFALAAALTQNGDGQEEHVFTGRKRGGLRYSALCNGRFQGLGADCAKEALWRVTRACYVDSASPLFGCRVVAFVHDEIIAECPVEQCDAAARELGRLMAEGANIYLARVPISVEPCAMVLWSKNAEPVYDDAGKLVPWDPAIHSKAAKKARAEAAQAA